MELATSASASVCSAYRHLSSTPPATDGVSHGTQTSQPSRRTRPVAGGGLRRRCYAVLKQQRTRLYILQRCISMLLCWHEQDLSD